MDTNRSTDWGSLLMGIAFIIVALFAFRNPAASLVSLVVIIGVVVLLRGIGQILLRNRIRERTGSHPTLLLVTGVIDILFALLILFRIEIGILSLPFLFGIWMIFRSVAGFGLAGIYRAAGSGMYGPQIVLNILMLIVGIFFLFNPLSAYLTLAFLVGVYFLFAGIQAIAGAFS